MLGPFAGTVVTRGEVFFYSSSNEMLQVSGHGGAGPRGRQPRLGLAGAGGRRGGGVQQDEVTRGLQLQLQTFQQQAVAKFLGRYIFSIYLLTVYRK